MKKFFIFCAVVLTSVFFLRNPLLKAGLSFILPETVSYERAQWEKNEIVLHGVHFQDEGAELHIDEATLSFQPALKPLYLEMGLVLDHPEVLIKTGKSASALPLFLLQPHRFFGLKLEMKHGALDVQDQTESQRYYFSFIPGAEKENIGRFLLTLDPMLFHLPLLELGLELEEGGLAASLKTEGMNPAHLFQLVETFYSPFFGGWKGGEGVLGMSASAFFSPDFSLRSFKAEFLGKEVTFTHPERHLGLDANALEGKIFLPLFSADNKSLFSELVASFSVQGGSLSSLDGKYTIQEVEGDLLLEPEKDPHFNLRGELRVNDKSVPLVVSGKGEVEEGGTFWAQAHFALEDSFSTRAEISISCREQRIETFQFSGEIEGIAAEIELQKAADTDKGYNLAGHATLGNCATFECGCSFLSESAHEFLSAFQPHSGWFNSTLIPSSFSHPLLKRILPELDLEAEIALNGAVERAGLELSLQAEEMRLDHARATMQIPSFGMGAGKVVVRYGFENKEISAEVPFAGASIHFKEGGDALSQVEGICRIYNGQLTIEQMRALWKEISFEGELTLTGLDTRAECHVTGRVQGAHFEAKDFSVQDLACAIDLDSYAQTLVLSSGQGMAHIGRGAHYPIHFAKIVLKKGESVQAEFDLQLLEGKHEALRLLGRAREIAPSRWDVQFDENLAHFYRTKLGKTQLVVEESGRVHLLEASLTTTNDDLQKQLRFLRNCGFIGFDPALVTVEKATLVLHYSSLFSFEAEGKKLCIGNRSFGNFRIKGDRRNDEWKIEQLKLGDLILQTSFCWSGSKIQVPHFELRSSNLTCHGKAKLNVDLGAQRVDGETEIDFALGAPAIIAASRGALLFSFTPQGGLHIKTAELTLPDKSIGIKAEQISLDGSFASVSVKKIAFTTPTPFLGAAIWEFRELLLSQDQTGWVVEGKTLFQNRALSLQANSLREKRILIEIREERDPHGIKIQGKMDKRWKWEAVRGDFAGLDLDLCASKKQEDQLSGFVKVDLARLSAFLPKEWREWIAQFKLGKGFELIGDFNLPKEGGPSFQGKLLGRQFVCMGYLLENLDTAASLSFDQMILNQLSIRDRGMRMQIKCAKIGKSAGTKNWQIEAPLIQLHELSPSLMRRINGGDQEARPLVIKNFTLCDLQGSLSELATLRAKGHLNFTNAFKKESSLLDLPFELIKDFGLDPNLITPVYGEMDVELKAGRLYLKELRNAYSEARRSQFYLSDERPSFIDLNGNVHIDIKMKQNVTLKLVEPFTLKVRGTLAKPRLSI